MRVEETRFDMPGREDLRDSPGHGCGRLALTEQYRLDAHDLAATEARDQCRACGIGGPPLQPVVVARHLHEDLFAQLGELAPADAVAQEQPYQWLEQMAQRKQQKLTLNRATDVLTVQADQIEIERALSKLLVNALSYTPSGGSITLNVLKRDRCAPLQLGRARCAQTVLGTAKA